MTREKRLVEIRRLFKSIGNRLDSLEMAVEKEQLSISKRNLTKGAKMIDARIFEPDVDIDLIVIDESDTNSFYVFRYDNIDYRFVDSLYGLSLYQKENDELVEVTYSYDFDDINDLQLEILHNKIATKIETIIKQLNTKEGK
ncbi:hypothetical protein [Vibrio parahaemolyticus]|uniref:hypothetical protein n=1 Tax=Vibrio parahaemolyticus TaxID=670 RepID=UPI0004A2E0E0|nr:hypothetical protein [Vibrio parahaemolyticus]